MKISAIICEYNPLHNGHVHHIRETRRHGCTHLIAVLSDNFVQRGDVALLGKFDRASLAIQAGADLVLELPVAFSCGAAEVYATGAVSLLNALGVVDELSFGSSSGNLEVLELLTEASLSTTRTYQKQIRQRMQEGDSYPAAVWEIIKERYGAKVAGMMRDPNNLLAVEYLKAMHRSDSRFSAYTIPRRCVMHDSTETSGQFASASFIRKSVAEGDSSYLDFLPPYAARLLADRLRSGGTATVSQLERVALYRMRTITEEELLLLPDVNAALAGRFYAARNANSLEELFGAVKTKCYTMSRIRRIVMSALIGIRREDLQCEPPYARVLALNARGSEILAKAKGRAGIRIDTSLSRLRAAGGDAERFARLEERAAQVYGLAQGEISSAEQDYRARIGLEA
ncbi:MAG: nucleotidyltransferase family protein [Oscillospiraceae bacterium]|nr:nucleotidyltransferase family protein [Oscillospiraceae bacterium]